MQCEGGRTDNLSLSSVLSAGDLCWKEDTGLDGPLFYSRNFYVIQQSHYFRDRFIEIRLNLAYNFFCCFKEGLPLCFIWLKEIAWDSFTALLVWLPSLGETSQALLSLNRISLWKHLSLYPCFVPGVACDSDLFSKFSCNSELCYLREILRHFRKSYRLSSTYLRKWCPLGMAKYKRCLIFVVNKTQQ